MIPSLGKLPSFFKGVSALLRPFSMDFLHIFSSIAMLSLRAESGLKQKRGKMK